MKIGAYQFAVTGNLEGNAKIIENVVIKAAEAGVKLLLFPECSLTGYPPRDIKNSAVVDFRKVSYVFEYLQRLVNERGISVVLGAITEERGKRFNSAVVFRPGQEKLIYSKRALWGWDQDNFSPGDQSGIFEIEGWKVGVRICFEVRFPEYFRELYRERTDLNLILFYDVADHDDPERYELIKAHVRTRAVENVAYTLSVDAIHPYQAAPTGIYDRSGYPLLELKRNREGMLLYDLANRDPDFGEQGRRQISDRLTAPERQIHTGGYSDV